MCFRCLTILQPSECQTASIKIRHATQGQSVSLSMLIQNNCYHISEQQANTNALKPVTFEHIRIIQGV